MLSISWVTPTWFIDVDALVVPELAKTFVIHWTIVGRDKPTDYCKLEEQASETLQVDFVQMKSRWFFPTSFFEYIRFFRNIVDAGADIIYIDMAPQLYAFYASLLTLPKEKTVFAAHNVKTPKGAKMESFARYYMGKLLNSFQNFQVFSHNQLEYLNERVSGKNVLLAPLTLKEYGPKTQRNQNLDCVNFLSFGHIRHYKRIDLLIEAAQQLYEECKERFVVTIAGNCPGWVEYASLIRYPDLFNLEIGFIGNDEVAQLFSNADYLVLPYQDLAQSGAITVAFNYNVPVITSDIPQFLEFVEDGINGFVFHSEDVKSLKEVMKKALSLQKNDYGRLVQSTSDYVRKNYSLQSITERYVEYFKRLL